MLCRICFGTSTRVYSDWYLSKNCSIYSKIWFFWLLSQVFSIFGGKDFSLFILRGRFSCLLWFYLFRMIYRFENNFLDYYPRRFLDCWRKSVFFFISVVNGRKSNACLLVHRQNLIRLMRTFYQCYNFDTGNIWYLFVVLHHLGC